MEATKAPLRKVPFLDLSGCTDCESCTTLYPGIFRKNPDTGCIELIELPHYPEDAIQELMALCPGACITWEEY